MKAIGQIPSPYGTLMDVFHDPKRNPDPDLCFFHTMEDCMTLAGVYGAENRKRCFEEISRRGPDQLIDFDVFMRHGGRKAKYTPLTKPAGSIYQTLPKTHGIEVPLENWVTLVMDQPDWYRRGEGLLSAISSCIDGSKEWSSQSDVSKMAFAIGVQSLLTAALEHLHETDISCLEAAAFYALSVHGQWVDAGLEWLEPIRNTWFRDWLAKRPSYSAFAEFCRVANPYLPTWICEG